MSRTRLAASTGKSPETIGKQLTMSDRTKTVLLVIALTACALILRIYALDEQSFWCDETITYRVIAPGWSGLLWRGACTSIPPLYFALVRLFFMVSPTEFSMRCFSVLCGVLAIPVFFHLASLLLGKRIAIVGTILLVFSPFHVWYSQDARPYALLMLLSLTATLFFLKLLHEERRRWWIGYTVFTAMSLYVHVVAVLVIAFHLVLWVAWPRDQRPKLGKLAASLAVTSALFAPVVPILIKGMLVAPGVPRRFSLLTFPYTFYAMFAGFSLGPSTYTLHNASFATAAKSHTFAFLLVAAAFVPTGFLGLRSLIERRSTGVLLALWIVIPVLGLACLSACSPHAYNVRHISPVLFPCLLVCAAGICWVRNRGVRPVLLCLVLGCQGLSVWNHFTNDEYAKSDFRSLASFLERTCERDDAIYVVNYKNVFDHYYRQAHKSARIPLYNHYGKDTVDQSLANLAEGASRVWLVEGRWEQLDPQRYAKRFCESRFDLMDDIQIPPFTRLEVTCYSVQQYSAAREQSGFAMSQRDGMATIASLQENHGSRENP